MYMTETPINTACFDMAMNSVRRFRTLRKFHCTALTCPVVYGIAAIVRICTVFVSAEPGAAKHGAAFDRLYPVREAPGRHSLLKLNFRNKSKL